MKLLADDIIADDLGFHYRYSSSIKVQPEPHTHDFYEFFITFEDQIEHHINGVQQLLDNGTLVLIRPDDVHGFGKSGIHAVHILNVAFRSDTFNSMCAYLEHPDFISDLLKEPFPPMISLTKLEQKWIKSRFEELAFSTEQDLSIIKYQFKMQLVHLFYHFFKRHQLGNINPIPSWLSHLKELIQQKDHFLAGLPRLIELSGRSHAHLNRSIQQHYGMTCTEWINSFKVKHAANLLLYTDMEIIDVVYEAGFENVSYFYEVFKHQYQLSPAKYRRTHRKNVI
jgi:AraC family cel operon transcriptional repressor